MKQLLIIFNILFVSCQQSTQSEQFPSKLTVSKTESQTSPNCNRCDVDTALFTTEKWKNCTYLEINSFLCAWDKSCDWPENYLDFRDGQYFGAAWDMLFVLFYEHFEEYNEILNKNDSLNLDYLIQLYSTPGAYDLPHDQILSKLKNKTNKTTIDLRLIKAFENSLKK